MNRMPVRCTSLPLIPSDFGFEIVVVGFQDQSRNNLGPCGLRNEEPVGVIGSGKLLNVAVSEKVAKALLQGFEMVADSGPHHDSVGIHGLAVFVVPLAGTVAATLSRMDCFHYDSEGDEYGSHCRCDCGLCAAADRRDGWNRRRSKPGDVAQ